MLAAASFGQQELGPTANHMNTVPDELFQQFFDRHDAGLAVDQCQENQRERVLQRRELVELIQYDFGIGIALDVDHQPHRLLEVALVLNSGNTLDPAIVDERRNSFDNTVSRGLEGYFRNDDSLSAFRALLNSRAGTNDNRAAARVVTAANATAAADDTSGGEIRTRYEFQQFVNRNFRLLDHADQRVADLAGVVRWHRRCHAYRDSVGTVHQQVGKLGRQHRRFCTTFVIGRHKVDRVQLDVVQDHRGDRRESSLGVPHGRRWKTGDRTEIPLFVDQHRAHVPFLGHAYQRGIDHAFAVGMVVAAGITRDLGALDAR